MIIMNRTVTTAPALIARLMTIVTIEETAGETVMTAMTVATEVMTAIAVIGVMAGL